MISICGLGFCRLGILCFFKGYYRHYRQLKPQIQLELVRFTLPYPPCHCQENHKIQTLTDQPQYPLSKGASKQERTLSKIA